MNIEKEYTEYSTFASGTITTYINRQTSATHEEYKRYMNNIKPYEKSKEYPSIPLSCGILDDLTKKEIDKVVQEKFDSLFTDETFSHVYNVKNRTLCTINNEGKTVFEYKCHTPNTEKALKKKLYNI